MYFIGVMAQVGTFSTIALLLWWMTKMNVLKLFCISAMVSSMVYRQGIQQGKIALARELKHIIDTHLEVSIKPEKSNNKVSIKALEKFNNLLDEESYK